MNMDTRATFLVILAAASVVSASPHRWNLPPTAKKAEILPVIECPDNIPYPLVITPSVSGHGLTANQYVVCYNGQPYVLDCPEGLFFNWSTMTCDFPHEKLSSAVHPKMNGTSPERDLGLVPAGPVPVPVWPQPQLPIPIWWSQHNSGGGYYPIPSLPPYPVPVTKPDPSVIMPIPVLPAYPPPGPPFPVPITKPDPSVIPPIPVLPAYPRLFPPYPLPVTKPDPSVIIPIPVLPAHPPPFIPRPVPYYYYY